jgi:hypothetical protein
MLRFSASDPDPVQNCIGDIHKGLNDSMRGKSFPESVFSCKTQTLVTFLFTRAFFASLE